MLAPPEEKDSSLPTDSFLKSFVPINFYTLESLSQTKPGHTFQEEGQFFILLFDINTHWNGRHPHASHFTPTAQALQQQQFWGSAVLKQPRTRTSLQRWSWQKRMSMLLHQEERQKQPQAQPHGLLPSTQTFPAQDTFAPVDACSVSGA